MKGLIPASDAIFRVLFSLIFVGAGIRHLARPDEIVARLLDAPLAHWFTAVAPAPVLVALAAVVLVPGGVALLVGYHARLAALVLTAVLIPITISVDLGHTRALGPLFKNIALLGGLIHFMSKGAGEWSLDARRFVR